MSCRLLVVVCIFFACGAKSLDEKPVSKTRVVRVKNATELKGALTSAKPGDSIVLADGFYSGKFVIEVSGKSEKPIVLTGSRAAILDAGNSESGYVVHLKANYWRLKGFTVQNGLKGVVTDNANHNLMEGLLVQNLGEEAIHLRTFSSKNIIQNNEVKNAGLYRGGYGEGIYIGSANSNWAKYSNGQPDKCDSNRVLRNAIGPGIAAECIDIKEGTTGGVISGNIFNSEGISGENSADSWMDVKGNGYLIEDNKGTNMQGSALLDGYQVNCAYEGWGNNNIFKSNQSDVNAAGHAINIRLKSSKGEVSGTVVYENNTAVNAGKGVSNIALTTVK